MPPRGRPYVPLGRVGPKGGPQLRALLEAQRRYDLAQSMRRGFVHVLAAASVFFGLALAWPTAVSPGGVHTVLRGYLAVLLGAAFQAGNEWRWLRRRDRLLSVLGEPAGEKS